MGGVVCRRKNRSRNTRIRGGREEVFTDGWRPDSAVDDPTADDGSEGDVDGDDEGSASTNWASEADTRGPKYRHRDGGDGQAADLDAHEEQDESGDDNDDKETILHSAFGLQAIPPEEVELPLAMWVNIVVAIEKC